MAVTNDDAITGAEGINLDGTEPAPEEAQATANPGAQGASKPKPIRLNKQSQASLVDYVRNAMLRKHAFSSFRNKLAAIDVAYAAYKAKSNDETNADGVDVDSILSNTDVTITVAASQVDTVVAYLTEVFLSGSPIFPVVSGTKNKEIAERFEAVIDYHAKKGKYVRQLAMGIKDAAKYDFVAMEHVWDSMSPFFPVADSPFTILAKTEVPYTKLKRLDPYNTIWDYRVAPADVSDHGEFAGYIEMLSMCETKRYFNKLSERGEGRNITLALGSKLSDIKGGMQSSLNATAKGSGSSFERSYNFTDPPTLNDYVKATDGAGSTNWDDWLASRPSDKSVYPSYAGQYEVTRLYARIIPKAHGIQVPRENTPQIWELVIINGQHLVHAAPIKSPYNSLPISIGQPLEDGLRYQTKSLTERSMPFQNAASDMYNVKINSSKRAINDRMLYDTRYVNQMDINSVVPAAKIPVSNLGMNKSIKDVAVQLPFDGHATSGAMGDLAQTLQMSNMVNGLNPFRQGQSLKGNRTKAEFEGVYDSSELRTRLLALMLEVHLFMPVKDTLKLNILLHNEEIEAIDFNKGEAVTLNPTELQNAVIEFKIADGYRPKDKLMSTEDLQIALTYLAQDPKVGIEYNAGDMFAHLMSLRGVKGLADYKISEDDKNLIIQRAMPYLQEMIVMIESEQGGGRQQ